jgi:tRNA (guanine37-N1)-methyltransferase
VDERILSLFEIEELSIGDYVLTGGEAPAAVIVDAVTRLIPGVLGNFESALADSHTEKLLGTPVFTRPEEFMGLKVPEMLISGDHKLIEKMRRKEAVRKTFLNRHDLLERLINNGDIELDEEEKNMIDSLKKEKNN